MSSARTSPLIMEVSPDWRILLFSIAVTAVVRSYSVWRQRSVPRECCAERKIRRSAKPRPLRFWQVTYLFPSGAHHRAGCRVRPVPANVAQPSIQFRWVSGRITLQDRPWFPERLSDSDKAALYTQLPERVAALPGVLSATLSQPPPLEGGWTNNVGIPAYSATERPEVYRYRTTPGFFCNYADSTGQEAGNFGRQDGL